MELSWTCVGILPVAGYALAKAVLGLACMGTMAVIAICSDDDNDEEAEADDDD